VGDDPLASGWFYHLSQGPAGEYTGPLSWEQLAVLGHTGALQPADLVWHHTFPGWMPAGEIPGLLAAPAPTSWSRGASPPTTRGSRSPLVWVIPFAAILVVALGLGLFFGLRNGDEGRELSASTTTQPATASTIGPTGPTSTSSTVTGRPGTWLVMMYQDADDEILEEDIAFDLNEAELVGSSEMVTIVAQMDRYVGGYAGDDDVTSTKRYLVTQDDDIYTVNSPEMADVGEVNMGDGQTLYDFATWAITTYPAEHCVLVMANHGGGWTGGWSDNDPEEASALTMQEIDATLGAIVADTGIGTFELVGFDACLMGQLEVMSAIAPHARYGVGSEETEPALGWAYGGFLQALTEDTAMTGSQLGQAVVDAYITKDIRVTDDGARAVLTGGEYTAESVIEEMKRTATISAVDLSAIPDLNAAVNALTLAVAETDQALVAQARAYAQSYTGIFGDEYPPSFIDLGHFTDLLAEEVGDPVVVQAAGQVRSVLTRGVIAEFHGEERPASSGLTIYFPNSQEYAGAFREWPTAYTPSIGRFAAASLWDDYLTFHYTGDTFDPSLADVAAVTPAQSMQTDFTEAVNESAPAPDAEIIAPDAVRPTIAPITVSASQIGPDGLVTLSTSITGSNVAYVYYYVSYYWEDDGSYLTADAGFIEPGATKEMGGVYYPDWGEGDVIPVEYDWEPTLYFMSDGNEANDQFAFFSPTTYGADTEHDIYTVRGTYTLMDSGTQVDVEIDFSGEGDMLGVWGFTEAEDGSGGGAWHEIIPQPGDTFTITDEYLEFDQNPDGEFVDYNGGTMTFGGTPFTMVPYDAYSGDYALGIGVEDLDGNVTWEFAEVTVAE
jgi:hypothetical protein